MRLVRLVLILLMAVACAGCAAMPAPDLGPAPIGAAPPPDLDNLMLARGPALIAADAAVLPPPVPAAVLPGPAPGGDEPYRLDSGDRLRIVVFGQDGLSNTYIVDATGKIAMPLIGTVTVRGCTTTQLARVIADKLRQGYVREPHVAIE